MGFSIKKAFILGGIVLIIGVISTVYARTTISDSAIVVDGDLTVTGTTTINGNVGIGGSVQTEKVEVNGNVKTSACSKFLTWVQMQANMGYILRGAGGLNDSVGFVVGDQVGTAATILRTADGGATWTSISNTLNNTLYALNGIPGTNIVIAIGGSGSVMRSTDAGLTWAQVFLQNDAMDDVAFADSQIGVMVGAGPSVVRSTNAGANWSAVASGSLPSPLVYMHGVAFGSSTTGVAVGAGGAIWRTVNAGASWTNITSPVSVQLNKVVFASATTVIAVGNQGVVIRSSDAGQTWSSVVSGTALDLSDIGFGSSTSGFAAGASAIIIETTDGGLNWRKVTIKSHRQITGLVMLNEQKGFTSGYTGTIFRTQTGSSLWSEGACLDIAEVYESSEMKPESGSIVGLDLDGRISKTKNAYDRNIVGVVSENPAIIIEGKSVVAGKPELSAGDPRAVVALAGRVPVKVNLENGPIEVGDPITSSSTPGVGMKATDSGKIIGFALEPFPNKTNVSNEKILVNVQLRGFTSPNEIEALKEQIEMLKTVIQ